MAILRLIEAHNRARFQHSLKTPGDTKMRTFSSQIALIYAILSHQTRFSRPSVRPSVRVRYACPKRHGASKWPF